MKFKELAQTIRESIPQEIQSEFKELKIATGGIAWCSWKKPKFVEVCLFNDLEISYRILIDGKNKEEKTIEQDSNKITEIFSYLYQELNRE